LFSQTLLRMIRMERGKRLLSLSYLLRTAKTP
jgi:hypothetical protein